MTPLYLAAISAILRRSRGSWSWRECRSSRLWSGTPERRRVMKHHTTATLRTYELAE